ncbi:MAG: hypothetical protein KC777_29965 [Cyanobacteria bacterium HKST-UBA02]|nr:hypothetical protein [Cyanobacteria bacterium HKST-UBA02]
MRKLQRKTLDRIRKSHTRLLLDYPGVSGISVGNKITDGEETKEPCIRVFVEEKLPEKKLSDVIPKSLSGVRTDVIKADFRTMLASSGMSNAVRKRPVVGGISIGTVDQAISGTITLVVLYKRDPDNLYALSCSHVLCSDDILNKVREVAQPGPSDSGGLIPENTIGKVAFAQLTNNLDAAIASILPPEQGRRHKINELTTKIDAIGVAREGLTLCKIGKVTGEQVFGHVVDTAFPCNLLYPSGERYLHSRAILVESVNAEPFMLPGDSGALAYDRYGAAVGMMIGGDEKTRFGVANHFSEVVAGMEIDL